MARECQEKNAKGLTMVAVGMNKAAEELMILDESTQADLASGKYRDQRRGSFGTSAPAAPRTTPAAQTATAPRKAGTPPRTAPATREARGSQPAGRRTQPPAGGTQPPARGTQPPARGTQPSARRPAAQSARGRPWTERQERLALLYNEQGLRPAEIAAKLGVSSYRATQIILAARNRAKA